MCFLFHDAFRKLVEVDVVVVVLFICYMHFTMYRKMLCKIIVSICTALSGVHYDTNKLKWQ